MPGKPEKHKRKQHDHVLANKKRFISVVIGKNFIQTLL